MTPARFNSDAARVAEGILATLALLVSALITGCGAARERTVRLDRSDMPLTGASAAEAARFAEGDGLFEAVFRAPDGLGPLYIRSSCEACHAADGRGPGLVAKMSTAASVEASGERGSRRVPTPALPFGNTQRPYVSGGARTPLVTPGGAAAEGLRVSYRLPPAVWGRGYLESVSDGEIERLATAAAARPGPIKGRIHRVRCASEAAAAAASVHGAGHRAGSTGLIGRFGLKARIATLDEFAADALQSDMGLTSPLRPRELPNPDGLADDGRPGIDVDWETVQALGDYVRLIEIPRPTAAPAGVPGRVVFERAQCAICHVPELRTRPDYPVAALAGIAAPVYTDLLLHDMGAALADGVVDGDAGPREWRTAPLMGLRFMPALLHDGRARTVEDAILAHEGPGSEANDAVAVFRALGPADRDELLAFVRAL